MSTVTIGEVLNRLREEFDDLTISKIRFLEAEGLVSPDRTESGYRKFTVADVDRLRYILRAQRDRFLPLKVIRTELDQLDAGLPVEAGAGAGAVEAPPLLPDDAGSEVQLSAAQLARASGLTEAHVAELSDHGLVGEAPHDADDLRVAGICAELLGIGIEVRHLRMYRQFAEREAAFAEQLVSPLVRQRNPESRQRAAHQVERLAASGHALHRALLAARLREVLRP